MWIPTPIYERIPQFWFLLGLLFIATGLFLGFEYTLVFWYAGIGFACCMYGVGIFFVRIGYRRGRKLTETVIERPTDESIELTIEQPIDATVEQPIDATVEQPIDATVEQPIPSIE